ncbi:GntR family transcriptional regulator [Azorhizophilus paspali]|uniref:GntR family transcriptional regulator n=1 Tax=Azorhizophilus paspali TaxID=69963 RepID=UPI00362789A6
MERQSLYKQVYSRIVSLISQEALTPGQRVPSIRSLASELRLSRNTVEIAYSMLISDGYLEARGQAGTFVSRTHAIRRLMGKSITATQTPIKKVIIIQVAMRPLQELLWATSWAYRHWICSRINYGAA